MTHNPQLIFEININDYLQKNLQLYLLICLYTKRTKVQTSCIPEARTDELKPTTTLKGLLFAKHMKRPSKRGELVSILNVLFEYR